MAEREEERRGTRGALLVGAGRRAREAAAVLAALSSLDGAGERRREPLAVAELGDLEDLLARRTVEGLLILEAGRVPAEDIGFVRRFLERNAPWRLVVVGENEHDPPARALLALARAQWLAWPPDLGQLAALLPAAAAREGGRGRRGGARGRRAAEGGVEGGVDLGNLLEELLAGAALRGEGAARYHFAPRDGCVVAGERGALAAALEGWIELARLCAGGDGLVRVVLARAAESLRIHLDFPRGIVGDADPAKLLEGPPERIEPPLREALAAARRGTDLLRESGAEVELAAGEPGRLRCAVTFAAQAAPLEPARLGKAEDPFA